jgi:hypothetical protein
MPTHIHCTLPKVTNVTRPACEQRRLPPFEAPLMHPKTCGNLIIYGMPPLPIEVAAEDVGG